MNKFTSKEISSIKTIFNQFDSDKDGYINRTELCKLATALNDPLTRAELEDFFMKIDTDNDGKITWNEFITYWVDI
jgi:Ca2+-binding EF-hand superfamily protein